MKYNASLNVKKMVMKTGKNDYIAVINKSLHTVVYVLQL